MENNIAISVKKLSKRYEKFLAVNDISFEVKKGQIFAFLGPNGAGKSTTIKILTTLLSPTSGEIYINGFNLETQKDDIRKSFGIVFQDSSLDDQLTTYENMDFHGILYGVPKKLREIRIKELLKIVKLWDRRNSFVRNFSGGMKRRLEIARGLIHRPKIFFLDEPTIGLDPQTRNQIWKYILDLNRKEKITIFFTTHYMEEAEQIANIISIIDHGKIIINGTAKELVENTKTKNLEEAFIKLTGDDMRDKELNREERFKMKIRKY